MNFLLIWLLVQDTSFQISAQSYSWILNSTPYATNLGPICISSDGTKMDATFGIPGAVSSVSKVHYSTNSGITWSACSPPNPNTTYKGLTAIASSYDGSKVVTVGYTDYSGTNWGFIYQSLDFGHTWYQTGAPWGNWHSIASSGDGSKLFASNDYGIWVSTNGGTLWEQTISSRNSPLNLCTSLSGQSVFAEIGIGNSNYIFISTNYGTTWVSNSTLPNLFWGGIACSTDANSVVICGRNGNGIYRSTNSGVNWFLTGAPSKDWFRIVTSMDGSKLVAGANGDDLYASFDSGNTWTDLGITYSGNLAISGNGKFLVMSTSAGLYIGSLFAPPKNFAITIKTNSSTIITLTGLSVYPYILQATSTLNPPNWFPVVTNLTDSHGYWSVSVPSIGYTQRFFQAIQE